MSDMVIVGTGGMGREAAAWLIDAGRSEGLLGYLDDDPSTLGKTVAGLPVLGDRSWLTAHPDTGVVVALGLPRVRARVVDELTAAGVRLVTIVHPTAVLGPRTTIGEGSILCPGVVATSDVTIGRSVILNYGALLGHDVTVGDDAFIAPGAHVAGAVTVGARADLGIGCSIIQGLTIGDDAVIGAGAVVIRDVPRATTVVGVPARPLKGDLA